MGSDKGLGVRVQFFYSGLGNYAFTNDFCTRY